MAEAGEQCAVVPQGKRSYTNSSLAVLPNELVLTASPSVERSTLSGLCKLKLKREHYATGLRIPESFKRCMCYV